MTRADKYPYTSCTPGAKLVVIKDGPHGINASHPAEFNAALLEFLRA